MSEQSPPLPPPSFSLLIHTLSLQALAALGQVPDPSGKVTAPRLDLAKHTIDTLGILEEKTRGNLTSEEAALLERILHELRLAYVALSRRPAAPPPAEPPAPMADSSA
jgi:hypothetical protein